MNRHVNRVTMLASFVAIGCAAPDRTREPDDSSPPTETASSVAAAPWYSRTRAIDLTGDGAPDSVRLEAVGTRPDSLRVALSLLVDGAAAHVEEWSSAYELEHVDRATLQRAGRDAFLRARLDSVLASVKVQALDAPGARLMREDSAALQGIAPRPTHRVSFSYGFETMARLAWDAPRRRFVKLWSCC